VKKHVSHPKKTLGGTLEKRSSAKKDGFLLPKKKRSPEKKAYSG